jgi:uncharacterized protein YjiS (DUF1127 family)
MNTTSGYPLRLWRQVKQRFVTWQDRTNTRIEVRNLADPILRDIGLSRGGERFRPPLPFWIP